MKIKENSSLFIIDMQNDFVKEGGALYVPSFDEERKRIGNDSMLIENIVQFANNNNFQRIFATEDSHPNSSIEFDVFPPHCVIGTEGQKYIPELKEIYNRSKKLIKGIDPDLFSFSIVFSNIFTNIISYLREYKIENIYMVGVAYDYCVGESAMALKTQGFDVYVMKDFTKSVSEESSNLMDKKLELYGVNKT